jgi:hypothetical protein
MSGYGPSADKAGNVFVVTGNSKLPRPFETLVPVPVGTDTYLSDSVVKFDPDLKILDFFTSEKTYGQEYIDRKDADLGSGGVLLVPEDDVTRALPIKSAIVNSAP